MSRKRRVLGRDTAHRDGERTGASSIATLATHERQPADSGRSDNSHDRESGSVGGTHSSAAPKLCAACQTPLPERATVCSSCKSYQNTAVRRLQQFAAIIGLLSIVGGAVVYMVKEAPAVRRVLFWRDELRLTNFITGDALGIANLGDGPVYINHYVIRPVEGVHELFVGGSINLTVEPRSVVSYPFPKAEDIDLIFNPTQDQLREAAPQLSQAAGCYRLVWYGADEPMLLDSKRRWKGEFWSIRGICTISGVSVATGEPVTISFAVEGVLGHRVKCESP